MRRVLNGLLPLLFASTAAAASSIHALPATPSSRTSSIVTRGVAAGDAGTASVAAHSDAGEIHRIGPSVIAIGAEALPAADEQVAVEDSAATADKAPEWMSLALPEVIRGGVRGGAFPDARQAAPDAAAIERVE